MTPITLPPQPCAVQAVRSDCAAPPRLLLAQAAGSEAAAEPSAVPRQGKTLPNQVRLAYRLSWNGLPANGEMQWQRNGSRYRIELKLAAAIGPTLRYRSEGRIDGNRLIPEQYQAWRNGEAREKARFDWNGMTLRYGDGEDKEAPLQRGAQDLLSVDWQLALNAGRAVGVPLQVTNGKKVYHYTLTKAGSERSDGLAVTVYRTRQDGDVAEFSLASALYRLPARIRYKDDQKTVEMTATRIEVNGQTVWPAQ